jgi:hypothetical protein
MVLRQTGKGGTFHLPPPKGGTYMKCPNSGGTHQMFNNGPEIDTQAACKPDYERQIKAAKAKQDIIDPAFHSMKKLLDVEPPRSGSSGFARYSIYEFVGVLEQQHKDIAKRIENLIKFQENQ